MELIGISALFTPNQRDASDDGIFCWFTSLLLPFFRLSKVQHSRDAAAMCKKLISANWVNLCFLWLRIEVISIQLGSISQPLSVKWGEVEDARDFLIIRKFFWNSSFD